YLRHVVPDRRPARANRRRALGVVYVRPPPRAERGTRPPRLSVQRLSRDGALSRAGRCGPDRPVRARPRPLPPGRRLRRRRELALLVGVLLRAEHPGDRRRHHVDLLHRSVPAAPVARRPDVYTSCLRTPEDLVRASRRGPDPASHLGPIRACREIRGRRPSRGGAGPGRLERRTHWFWPLECSSTLAARHPHRSRAVIPTLSGRHGFATRRWSAGPPARSAARRPPESR